MVSTTGPITHSPSTSRRAEAPVWVFHTLVSNLVWLTQVVRWWWVNDVVGIKGRDAVVLTVGFVLLFAAAYGMGTVTR